VQIGFANPASARIFNELEQMRRAFGPELAYKIANRLALLSAAGNLAQVPTSLPIGCRPLDAGGTRFAVTITSTRRLAFRALDGVSGRGGSLEKITAIEVRGVEDC
jgi:hypothetical protein